MLRALARGRGGRGGGLGADEAAREARLAAVARRARGAAAARPAALRASASRTRTPRRGRATGAAEIRRAYAAWVEALGSQRGVVLALDDLHWADPSTRELAEELLEVTDRAPVLLAVAFRSSTPPRRARASGCTRSSTTATAPSSSRSGRCRRAAARSCSGCWCRTGSTTRRARSSSRARRATRSTSRSCCAR